MLPQLYFRQCMFINAFGTVSKIQVCILYVQDQVLILALSVNDHVLLADSDLFHL
jgi:hypothetical protein